MDLRKRLQEAINRGQTRATHPTGGDPGAMTPEKLKNLHNQFRLELSSYIESVVAQIVDQLPGFNQETLFGDKGWGTAVYRDDLLLTKKVRDNHYSRLEMFIRPMNDFHILDLATKATIRNREVWNRSVFHPLVEVNLEVYREQINLWAVQFVEQYSASK